MYKSPGGVNCSGLFHVVFNKRYLRLGRKSVQSFRQTGLLRACVLMDQALRNGFIKLLESNFSDFDFCTVQRYVSSFNSCAKRGF